MKLRQLMFFSFELGCLFVLMRCTFCVRKTTTHHISDNKKRKTLTTNYRAALPKPVRSFTSAM